MSFVSQQTELLWVCFVAGLISPWNLPLYLLTWKIAPAIACGNTVVAKPSEMTSVTAWMMCKLLEKAGKSCSVLRRGKWGGNACLCIIFFVAEIRKCSKTLGRTVCCSWNAALENKKLSLSSHYPISPAQLLPIFFRYLLMKCLHVAPFPFLHST